MTTHDLTTAEPGDMSGGQIEKQREIELEVRPGTGIEGPAEPAMAVDVTRTVDPAAPLFESDETERFRSEWLDVQSGFVDQPREAVERADRLVAEVMQRLAAQFAEGRAALEHDWDGSVDVSTEDLRVTMTRYRSFFERLLSA